MTRVGLILAVATRVEINHWTRRHQGRREITRVRVAAAGRHSNLSDLISTQVAATVCAVNDDGDGDKNLGYNGHPDALWDENLGAWVYPDAKGYDYMKNPTIQPFGDWIDSYIDRADVTMMQLSTSDESGASKCESSGRTTAQSSTDAAVLVAALSKREVLGEPGKVTAAAFQDAWKEWGPKLAKFGNQRALFKHFMPQFNDRLPTEIVQEVLKRRDPSRFDTPGMGALAFGYTLYQLNHILADALLDGESALLDEKLLVEAFAHLGERAPKDAAEIAELSVWALKKALHVAEIDTALMEDITFAFINGLYMKLRGV